MKQTIMISLIISFWVLTASLAADKAAAQNYVELRSAISRAGAVHRYFDYNHVFHNKVTLDIYYGNFTCTAVQPSRQGSPVL